MRDSNDQMIELLGASSTDNIFSSLVLHNINGEIVKLRVGIDPTDYSKLKRILEFRPFENTGVAAYRYFFPLSYRKDPDNQDLAYISVRVEQLVGISIMSLILVKSTFQTFFGLII